MFTVQRVSNDDWPTELMSRQESLVDAWTVVIREITDRMYEHADDTTERNAIMNIADELSSIAVRMDRLSSE